VTAYYGKSSALEWDKSPLQISGGTSPSNKPSANLVQIICGNMDGEAKYREARDSSANGIADNSKISRSGEAK